MYKFQILTCLKNNSNFEILKALETLNDSEHRVKYHTLDYGHYRTHCWRWTLSLLIAYCKPEASVYKQYLKPIVQCSPDISR